MRHADAASMPGTPDHERPLTPRGERDASTTGRWLRANVAEVSAVTCSTATRARRTCELVIAEFADALVPTYDLEIYRADSAYLLDLARTETGGEVVLMIGHNPAVAEAADHLAEEPLPGFPAGAAAVFDLDRGTTRLAAFFVP